MAVVPRKRSRTTVFFVATSWRGEKFWERSGTDRREADRLDQRRKREVKAGTFVPRQTGAATVGAFLDSWLARRVNRSSDAERTMVRSYAMPEWFCSMQLQDVRKMHAIQLAQEVRSATLQSKPGKVLAPKYAANTIGVLRKAFQDAEDQELVTRNPFVLPRGTMSRRVQKPRGTYPVEAARAMVLNPGAWVRMVWNALAIYTGMRKGEVCGRRFGDWNRGVEPLGSLTVATQYHDQPLKTDDEDSARPRVVPVHSELAAILGWWEDEGFELVFRRRPVPADWLVPRLDDPTLPHTESSAYKAWRRSCRAASVENRTVHSTRHTFITLARRGGARTEVLEVVTHNSRGAMIDTYTHWDWAPLCEAVACFPNLLVDAPVDGLPEGLGKYLERCSGSRTRTRRTAGETSVDSAPVESDDDSGDVLILRRNPAIDAEGDARQLLALAYADVMRRYEARRAS